MIARIATRPIVTYVTIVVKVDSKRWWALTNSRACSSAPCRMSHALLNPKYQATLVVKLDRGQSAWREVLLDHDPSAAVITALAKRMGLEVEA